MEIERIEFGEGQDNRVVLVGVGLPFRHGKAVVRHTKSLGEIVVTIRADVLTSRVMCCSEKKGIASRFLAALGI